MAKEPYFVVPTCVIRLQIFCAFSRARDIRIRDSISNLIDKIPSTHFFLFSNIIRNESQNRQGREQKNYIMNFLFPN